MDNATGRRPRRTSAGRPLFVAAIVLAALNLRPAMASLAPLIETIRLDLALSFTAMGLLTTIPVICLALFPVVANRLATRIGIERALVAALALITLATAVRIAGDQTAVLFASACAVGIGVAAGQAYVPAIAKRHFGASASAVTALYASTMSASAVVVVAATPPLVQALGSWPAGLAIWSLPALLAVALWVAIARRRSPTPPQSRKPAGLPWGDALAWQITSYSSVTFMLFFAVLAWYAPVYQAAGWSAGAAGSLVAVLLLAQLIGTAIVTATARRRASRRTLIAAGTALSAVGLVAAAFAPLAAPWIWAILVGLGLGVQFALALTLPVDYGSNPEEVGRLTAMAMSVGYLLAAIAPVAIGALRGATGGFAIPLVLLALLLVLFTLPALRLPAPQILPHARTG